MRTAKPLWKAVLLASILAVSPLATAQASPWRATKSLPSVEKSRLLFWLPAALSSLWAAVWGDEGCGLDPNGGSAQAPEEDDPDHGMSIDPNGGYSLDEGVSIDPDGGQ